MLVKVGRPIIYILVRESASLLRRTVLDEKKALEAFLQRFLFMSIYIISQRGTDIYLMSIPLLRKVTFSTLV